MLPQFSSSPGLEVPAILKAFEDPETSRAVLAALLAEPAPVRNLSLIPPRVVSHPNFEVDDLLAAAALTGTLGAVLVDNPGVLLRLVELHYAGADTETARRTFVNGLAPFVSHDNLLHLTLHHSPAIRSFTRDVLRTHVQEEGDGEGLRRALRFSGDYGILVPADALEGAALGLTSLEELEPLDEAAPTSIVPFVSLKTNLVWVVDRSAAVAQSERGRVTLDAARWWNFYADETHLAIASGVAALDARPAADLIALPVSLKLGLLRLSEPWFLVAGSREPAAADWRQVAGEGITALIKSGAPASDSSA